MRQTIANTHGIEKAVLKSRSLREYENSTSIVSILIFYIIRSFFACNDLFGIVDLGFSVLRESARIARIKKYLLLQQVRATGGEIASRVAERCIRRSTRVSNTARSTLRRTTHTTPVETTRTWYSMADLGIRCCIKWRPVRQTLTHRRNTRHHRACSPRCRITRCRRTTRRMIVSWGTLPRTIHRETVAMYRYRRIYRLSTSTRPRMRLCRRIHSISTRQPKVLTRRVIRQRRASRCCTRSLWCIRSQCSITLSCHRICKNNGIRCWDRNLTCSAQLRLRRRRRSWSRPLTDNAPLRKVRSKPYVIYVCTWRLRITVRSNFTAVTSDSKWFRAIINHRVYSPKERFWRLRL